MLPSPMVEFLALVVRAKLAKVANGRNPHEYKKRHLDCPVFWEAKCRLIIKMISKIA